MSVNWYKLYVRGIVKKHMRQEQIKAY